MRPSRLVFLTLGWLAIGDVASAQQVTATIAGTVSGDTGVGLSGVTITALNRTTGIQRAVTTKSDGRYMISLPVEGEYDVKAELPGFFAAAKEEVVLPPNQMLTIDFLLKAAAEDTVAVIASAPLLDPRNSTVQQRVNERLAHSLPLFGRDFIQLTTLAAGFTGDPSFPSPQGQIYWTNNVLVDGASHFSKWRSATRAFRSGYGLESIKEIQVLTNRFSAEFGEALATVTNVVTRSGTDRLSGSGLFFFRDNALNSRPAFAMRKPPGGSQQYGVTFGGPLVKDWTRFWLNYEGHRSRGRNLVVSPAAPETLARDDEDEHLVFVRVDHQGGQRHFLTSRYNRQLFRWHHEPGGLALPGTGTSYRNDVHTILFSDALQMSNGLLSGLRLQFARYIDVRQDLQPTVFISRAGYSEEGGRLGPEGFGANPEDTLEAAETLSYGRGPHEFRLGGGLKHVRSHNTFLNYGRGAYFFAGPPESFPRPFLFVQGLAPTVDAGTAEPRSVSGFGFVQDDWKVRPNLTLTLGLRYDIERVSNVRGYHAPADKNNIQPRLGVAWDPTNEGRTVVRGGAGVYTQQHLLFYINRVQLEGRDGTLSISLSPGSPLMPTLPHTLPAFGPGALLPPRDIHVMDSRFSNPYSIQATVGLEQHVRGTLLSADYVYLSGRDLMSLVDANAPASNLKPLHRTVEQADATRPIVPLPNTYRQIITLGNRGRSWYRGLQIKADRSTGSLQSMVSYTLSRAEDMANYQLPEDSRDILAEKARAITDVRHNLAVGLTWELPAAGQFLRGWSFSGLGVLRSHRPYNITWGDDRNGTTQNDARPAGRNAGKTDTFQNVDLGAARRFHRGAKIIEARVEVFNVLNTTNFDEYAGALLSPLFARPVSAFPKRRLQLAVIARF